MRSFDLVTFEHIIIERPSFNIIVKKIHYSQNLPDKIIWPQVSNENKTYKIIMIHSTIVPDSISKKLQFDNINIANIKVEEDVNFVLCSHYHLPFVVNRGRTVFVNPGVIMRRASNENTFIPKILIFEFSEDGVKVKSEKIAKSAEFYKDEVIKEFEFLSSAEAEPMSCDWRVFLNDTLKNGNFSDEVVNQMHIILKEAIKSNGIEFN